MKKLLKHLRKSLQRTKFYLLLKKRENTTRIPIAIFLTISNALVLPSEEGRVFILMKMQTPLIFLKCFLEINFQLTIFTKEEELMELKDLNRTTSLPYNFYSPSYLCLYLCLVFSSTLILSIIPSTEQGSFLFRFSLRLLTLVFSLTMNT